MYDLEKINELLTNDVVENILTTLEVPYQKEGSWIATNCPFHDLADGQNLKWRDGKWYCFSQCNKAYSMFDYVGQILDLSFVESVQWVSNTIGLSDDELRVNSSKMANRERLNKMKKLVTSKCYKQVCYEPVEQIILNDIEDYIHPYFLKQGFKESTLKHFGVGYSRVGELANRVTIPIDAKDGIIISISGRSIDGEEPKYHIVDGTDKSKTLYNISRIDKNDDYIIIVEGFKSCWRLYENGYKSVVATMGSSISDEQIKLLLKLCRKVICIGDNDEAGRKLNQKIYNRLYKFLPVYKVDMSEFTDEEKASPSDLDFDEIDDLIDKLEEIIK